MSGRDPLGLLAVLGDGDVGLRPLREDDRDALKALCAEDLEIWQIYAVSYAPGQFDASFDRLLSNPARLPFALEVCGSLAGMTAWIDSDPVRLSAEIGNTYIAPPYRGGALVVFPVQRVQSAQGVIQLEIDGETIVPSFGQLTVITSNGPVESPIGERGEFYLENLAPGPHDASVEYGDTSCAFTLNMPISAAPAVALGTLPCEVRR